MRLVFPTAPGPINITFFFPLPETDTKPFEEYVKKNHPDTKIIKPEIDREITLDI